MTNYEILVEFCYIHQNSDCSLLKNIQRIHGLAGIQKKQ